MGVLDLTARVEDQPKTAFITAFGLYQWQVMAFGLVNAGATCRRLAERIRALLAWLRLFGFIDNHALLSKKFLAHFVDPKWVKVWVLDQQKEV